jgi:hypothetical protein
MGIRVVPQGQQLPGLNSNQRQDFTHFKEMCILASQETSNNPDTEANESREEKPLAVFGQPAWG